MPLFAISYDFGEYIHVMYNTVSRLGGAYCYPHMDALCMRLSDEEEICVGIRRRYFSVERNVQAACCLLHTLIHRSSCEGVDV